MQHIELKCKEPEDGDFRIDDELLVSLQPIRRLQTVVVDFDVGLMLERQYARCQDV
jgi:hypothetical protein